MAWIKRNKFFVISMFVGLLLIGACGYLFWNNLGQVTAEKTEYSGNIGQIQNLRNANPYPNDQDIASANEDLKNERELMAAFQKVLVPFQVPPPTDDQGFKAYLAQTIFDLELAATNAGVVLPDGFAFAFTEQQKEFNYTNQNIRPWLEQVVEMKEICSILFNAKVNSLVSLQRVRVSPFDTGPQADFFDAMTLTNAPQVATPFKVAFRGFSRELADVLSGLAESSNCFVVESVTVQHEPEDATPVPVPVAAAQPAEAPPVVMNPGDDPRAFRRDRMNPTPPPAQPTTPQVLPFNPRGVPVTVLSEGLLRVSLVVQAVNIIGGGH